MAIDLMTAGGAVLEETTATASDILKGKTANDGEGEQITGTLELTGDAGAGEVLSGKTFYTTNPKSKQTGSMRNNGRWPDADKFTLEGDKIWMYKQDGYTEGGLGSSAYQLGNANSNNVLSGVSASSANGIGFSGTMPNHGSWSATLAPGGSVTVPWGCHSGGGTVTARGVNNNDVIGLIKIRNVPRPTASIYRPDEYILGLDNIGEMTGTTGNKWLAVISDDHHTISFADGTPSWFNYVYI